MNFSLDSVSDEALLRELRRRLLIAAQDRDEPTEWCDDCKHFRPWTSDKPVPENYNPCAFRHEVKFAMPREEDGPHGPYGFYRIICLDRVEIRTEG